MHSPRYTPGMSGSRYFDARRRRGLGQVSARLDRIIGASFCLLKPDFAERRGRWRDYTAMPRPAAWPGFAMERSPPQHPPLKRRPAFRLDLPGDGVAAA